MTVMNSAIRALIAPRSIAILGASNDLQKLNGRMLKFLVERLCAVSCFGAAAGDRLEELDLNPVLLSTDAAVAVDCVMVFR
jgi:hypothetical protein